MRVLRTVIACAVVLLLAGCLRSPDTKSAASYADPTARLVIGTTIPLASLDPASGDPGLPLVAPSLYQTLVQVAPDGGLVAPEAATCSFQDPTTYVCDIVPGQAFSNGDPLTAEDVVFSIRRARRLARAGGAADPFTPMRKIVATGNSVVFTLRSAAETWPFVLTTSRAAIVDRRVFPTSTLATEDQAVGSGPYALTSSNTDSLTFQPNPHYGGRDHRDNAGIKVVLDATNAELAAGLRSGDVDIAYPASSPVVPAALVGVPGTALSLAPGGGVEFVGFGDGQLPGTEQQRLAIRQAVAYLVDRASITDNAHANTTRALYSVIPAGVAGATAAMKQSYGTRPDATTAAQVLSSAGVSVPVELKLSYNDDHLGDAALAAALMSQLNASNLFAATVQAVPWDAFQAGAASAKYAAYVFEWEAPDADPLAYPSALTSCASTVVDNDCDSSIDQMVAAAKATTSTASLDRSLAQIQAALASDALVVPIAQLSQVVVARDEVSGLASSLSRPGGIEYWPLGRDHAE